MNPKVKQLAARAQGALATQPPIGGTVLVDFGADGSILVDGCCTNNVRAGADTRAADCTIALSLDTLDALESGAESIVWALLDGDVRLEGDRTLAEKFGGIVQAARG